MSRLSACLAFSGLALLGGAGCGRATSTVSVQEAADAALNASAQHLATTPAYVEEVTLLSARSDVHGKYTVVVRGEDFEVIDGSAKSRTLVTSGSRYSFDGDQWIRDTSLSVPLPGPTATASALKDPCFAAWTAPRTIQASVGRLNGSCRSHATIDLAEDLSTITHVRFDDADDPRHDNIDIVMRYSDIPMLDRPSVD